jgi:hypothetical protein
MSYVEFHLVVTSRGIFLALILRLFSRVNQAGRRIVVEWRMAYASLRSCREALSYGVPGACESV